MKQIILFLFTALIIFQSCEKKKSVVRAPVSLLNQTINMGNRYQIKKDSSYITFKAALGELPVIKGSLKAYQGTIFYDPNDVMSTSATIRFGTEGLAAADGKQNTALQGKDFLYTSKFPSIWFQGTDVKLTEKGFDLSGMVNIKNISKPVTIHIEEPTILRNAMNNQDVMIANGNLIVNRKDFGLGTTGNWASDTAFADEIEINFHFMCTSYTIDYLKDTFVKQVDGRDHAVGLVYHDVKANGLESGIKLAETLSKDSKYKSDDWLGNFANIGWILMVDGYGKESLPFYEMALKRNSKHLPSLLRLGDAYTIAAQHENALAHFEDEWSLSARARFTHIPHMIKLLSSEFELKNMK